MKSTYRIDDKDDWQRDSTEERDDGVAFEGRRINLRLQEECCVEEAPEDPSVKTGEERQENEGGFLEDFAKRRTQLDPRHLTCRRGLTSGSQVPKGEQREDRHNYHKDCETHEHVKDPLTEKRLGLCCGLTEREEGQVESNYKEHGVKRKEQGCGEGPLE